VEVECVEVHWQEEADFRRDLLFCVPLVVDVWLSKKDESVLVQSESVMEHPVEAELSRVEGDEEDKGEGEEEDLVSLSVEREMPFFFSLAPHSPQLLPSTKAT